MNLDKKIIESQNNLKAKIAAFICDAINAPLISLH